MPAPSGAPTPPGAALWAPGLPPSTASPPVASARPVGRVPYVGHVLVGFGHLFVYGGPVGGADQDAPVLQLPLEVAALRRLLRLFTTHLAPRPVGAGAEGLAHGPFGASQDEGVAAHVPR